MNTLVEMYSAELAQQPESKPALPDIMFKAAFPNMNLKSKTKELSRLSEDLFEDFNTEWTKRVEDGILVCLKEDMAPPLIIAAVPFLTREELGTVMAKVDEFLPGDSAEMAGLRVSELYNQYNNFMISATEILKRLYANHVAMQPKSNIIQAGGLTDSLGMPLIQS